MNILPGDLAGRPVEANRNSAARGWRTPVPQDKYKSGNESGVMLDMTGGLIKPGKSQAKGMAGFGGAAFGALMAALVILLAVFALGIASNKAEAAAQVYKGVFAKATATGAQSVTGVGFQPKAVVFWWTRQNTFGANNAGISTGYGFAANSTPSITQGAVAAAGRDNLATTDANFMQSTTYSIVILNFGAAATPMVARASVTAFGADGFTLDWQTNEAQGNQIHFLAIGGTDITNVKVGTFAGPAAVGNSVVTGVGFAPDAVLLVGGNRTGTTWDAIIAEGVMTLGFMSSASSQVSIGWSARDNQTAASNAHAWSGAQAITGLRRTGLDQQAALTSMDADGFTLNFTQTGGTTNYIYLAIKGGYHKMGTFNKSTSAGAQSVTGVGFLPRGLMLLSESDNVAAATARTAAPASNLTIGSADGVNSGSTWMNYRPVINSDANTFTYNNNVMRMGVNTNGTVTDYGIATFTSFDADGFTMNWSSSDATARNILYWAIGQIPVVTVGTTTDPANSSPNPGDTGKAVDGFTLATDVGSATITGITVTRGGTGADTDVSAVKLYSDGTTLGIIDGTDAQIGTTTTFSGGTASFTGLSEAVNTTAKNYLVVYDISTSASTAVTLTGLVTAITGAPGTVTNNDTTSATLTIPKPYTVTQCYNCHAYPPGDGSARNTPSGAVIGDHAKHNLVCTSCHIDNGTNLAHRASATNITGELNMADPINGYAGAYYDKDNSNTKTAADLTFAQSNSPVTGYCRATYCHGGAASVSPQWGVGTTTCATCHNAALGSRRKVLTAGGDIGTDSGKASYHINLASGAAGMSTACEACHDKSSHTTLADPQAKVYNADNVAVSYTFDGTAASVTAFCLSCHDGNGATRLGTPTNPFGDGTAPMDINTAWTSGTDRFNHSAEADCLDCHGDGANNPAAHGSSTDSAAGTKTNDPDSLLRGNSYNNTCFRTSPTNICHATGSTAVNKIQDEFTTTISTGGTHPVLGTVVPKSTKLQPMTTAALSTIFVNGWQANSVATCADCHSNNSTTGPRGPHGSGYDFILRGADTTIATVTSGRAYGTPKNSSATDSFSRENLCINCHASDVYGLGNAANPTGSQAALSQMDHSSIPSNTRCTFPYGDGGRTEGSKQMIGCTNCHAGGRTQNGAHGSTYATAVGSTWTSAGAGFMNGNCWTQAPDANGCYANVNDATWGVCTSQGPAAHN